MIDCCLAIGVRSQLFETIEFKELSMRCLVLIAMGLIAVAGCKRNETGSSTPSAEKGNLAKSPRAKALSREEGERKYNRMDQVLPVRTPLADVIKYFGQEPTRWEGKEPDRKAIWVLDDGSEIAIEFDNGLSGSDSATFKNK